MSRIGKLPITIPSGVDVQIKGSTVKVKGPKGELAHTFPGVMKIENEDGQVKVIRPSDEKEHRALHGMLIGVILVEHPLERLFPELLLVGAP